MLAYPFSEVVTSKDALRQLVGEPWQLNLCKQLPALDAHCRAFLARCPFVLIGTAAAAGTCDVSPRGDAPGFVTPLDDKTLLIPERPGNRRADTLRNILDNPHVC
jgi:predicted pyridoxine 5'-phosphate oxidase superfamily flavin-nucleotide-binding protein